MPTFIVMHAKPIQIQDEMVDMFMYVAPPNKVGWTNLYTEANTYPSKYAAKRHLKQLDNIPDNIKIVELAPVEAE